DPAAVRTGVHDCEVLRLACGEALLRPGEANDTIFVLLSGELAAHLDSAQRPEAAILIQPGESVGEMSAIDGQAVSARGVASTEAHVLALPGALFWSRFGTIPAVSRNLLAMLSMRMRQSNKVVLEAQRKQIALEYLRRELQTARQLQSSMLPPRGRLFPERTD